jgi:hypothetical protein
MKKFISGAMHRAGQLFAQKHPSFGKQLYTFAFLLFSGFLFSSCQKESLPVNENEVAAPASLVVKMEALNRYTGIAPATLWELQQAKAASAKYKNIDNALRDGYVDIGVNVENMGHHFMRMDLVDAEFDYRSPEILVYNKDHSGDQQLVAVEYAVPLSDPRPAGFSGSDDVWDGNVGFSLWLLHAWVWEYNPSGVFNSTNPLVHLH